MKKKLININSILNAKLIEEPWPHYIVDDAVNLDFFKLSSFTLLFLWSTKFKVDYSFTRFNGNVF